VGGWGASEDLDDLDGLDGLDAGFCLDAGTSGCTDLDEEFWMRSRLNSTDPTGSMNCRCR
jgi:hypothetical protein